MTRASPKVARIGLTGRTDVVASNLASIGAATQLPYSAGEFTVSNKGALAYSGGGPDHLPDVYLTRDGKTRRLTDLNSALLEEVNLGKLSELPVKSSADGRSIDAWELLPPNFDPAKKYPLILEIHGGPYASYGPTSQRTMSFMRPPVTLWYTAIRAARPLTAKNSRTRSTTIIPATTMTTS